MLSLHNSIAQESTLTLSGRVINEDEMHVQRLKLAVKPIDMILGSEIGQREPILSWARTTTDMNGNFTIDNIKPGSSRLVMLPEHGSDYEIVSIQIGDLTFHSTAFLRHFPAWFGKITFAIEPGTHIENVVVNVKKPRMRISGSILLDDRTPLANTKIEITVFDRKGNSPIYSLSSSRSSGVSGGLITTDAEGNFVSYFPDREAEHMVVVQYKSVMARSVWFRIEEGQRKNGLVFRLRDLVKHQNKREEREKARQAMWAINPTNGHAYKKIQCKDFADAIAKAKSENAYLVSINDQAEQRWLEAAFTEKNFFWIGLIRTEDKDTWQWTNEEELTYANWVSQKLDYMSINNGNTNIVMTFSSKKWTAIDGNSPIFRMVKHAIIEKEDFPLNAPEKRGNTVK